jgi:hypothetical protein
MQTQISPAPQAQTEERRPQRAAAAPPIKRWSLIVGVVLLLGLAVLIAVVGRKWPFTERAVIQSLQQESGAQVQIGGFREFYFPHPGCVAEQVVFRREAKAPTLITIQKLTIVGSYPGLLTQQVDTIRVEGFRLTASKQRAPTSLQSLGKTSSGVTIGKVVADGAEIDFPAAQAAQPPVVFRIPKLQLQDVADGHPLKFQATVQLPRPAARVDVSGRFGPWKSVQTPLSGSYTVAHLDLNTFHGVEGEINASGKFDGQLQAVKVEGSLDSPNFEVRQSKHVIHLAALYQATVNGSNGDVEIEAARAHFLRTTVVGAGRVAGSPGQPGKTATVELSSKQARIDDLLWMFVSEKKPAMIGPIVFRARVQIPPENREFTKKVKLQGDFGISDAQYPNPQTQKNVDMLSARARGEADKVEDIAEKPGNEAYDPGRVLSNVKGHVNLSEGVAHLENVSFDVPGASARVSGTYSLLSERVDLSGQMHMVADLPQTTTGVKSILLKVMKPFMHKSKHNESEVAIHMGGTYDHPTFTAVPRAKK